MSIPITCIPFDTKKCSVTIIDKKECKSSRRTTYGNLVVRKLECINHAQKKNEFEITKSRGILLEDGKSIQ